MNRRSFVVRAGMALGSAAMASALGRAEFRPGLNEAATAEGVDAPMAARYGLALDRALHGQGPAYTREFLLEDLRPTAGRRFTEYSGDLSGRYIGALATAARVYGTSFPDQDELVTAALALQKPEGYFGAGFHADKLTDNDLALLWGNGRLLVGLMEYYRLRPSAKVLDAATRLGDFLVAIGPVMNSAATREAFGAAHFASGYICWTQQTEGLALLYAVTRKPAYRKLGEEITERIERLPGDHVHGYLTSLRGVLELYALTGDNEQLKRVEAGWADVMGSGDVLLTGGVPEAWSPKKLRTEGCAEADWVRLNLGLWKATGKREYLDAAERAIFNELAMNQFATGDFGHRVLTATGVSGGGAARAWWCCSLHGLRCFPDVQMAAGRVMGDKVWLDLPVDGRIASEGFGARVGSSLAVDGRVRLRVERSEDERMLAIRRPHWADSVAVRVDGTESAVKRDGDSVVLAGALKSGQVVEIHYAMSARKEMVDAGGNLDKRTTYWFGPWLLGASSKDNPGYFNELHTQNRLVSGSEAGSVAVGQADSAFRVPIAAMRVKCIPAEFPEQPGMVELRAVAEQTGMETAGWELAFLTT